MEQSTIASKIKRKLYIDRCCTDFDSIDIRIEDFDQTINVYMKDATNRFFVEFDFGNVDDPVEIRWDDLDGEENYGICLKYISDFIKTLNFMPPSWFSSISTIESFIELLKVRGFWSFDFDVEEVNDSAGSFFFGEAYNEDLACSYFVCTQQEADEAYAELISKLKNRSNSIYDLCVETDTMSDQEFVAFCRDLLHENGFSDIELPKKKSRRGIDIIATKDEKRYGFQCVRSSIDLDHGESPEALEDASRYGCDVSMIMTNAYFASEPSVTERHQYGCDILTSMRIPYIKQELSKLHCDRKKLNAMRRWPGDIKL